MKDQFDFNTCYCPVHRLITITGSGNINYGDLACLSKQVLGLSQRTKCSCFLANYTACTFDFTIEEICSLPNVFSDCAISPAHCIGLIINPLMYSDIHVRLYRSIFKYYPKNIRIFTSETDAFTWIVTWIKKNASYSGITEWNSRN